MKFKIPFTISNIDRSKKRSKFFSSKIKPKKSSKLNQYLETAGAKLSREEYMGICVRNFVISSILLFVISTAIMALLRIKFFYLFGLLFTLLFTIFIFFVQMSYPKIYISRKQGNIEKNLIPALEDMLIQLNSGIPIYNILVSISNSDYGELSEEFKVAVGRISAGELESDVLNGLGKRNPSVFFRRTLWQISNGMDAGSDMVIVIRNSLKALNEEQFIQIQNYGNKLNPLIVLYMLISIIIPALSITFLTIISSMVNLPKYTTVLLFMSLLVSNFFFQILFLGLIKSRRPSLL